MEDAPRRGTTSKRLVGRHREQVMLNGALDRARQDDPSVLVVAGVAGIGKSRLVHDVIADRRDDWLVAVGRCVEEGATDLPYAPLTGILEALATSPRGEELLGDVERFAPGLAPLRGLGAAGDATTGLDQLRLLDGFTRLLRAISRDQPTVVVIEDIHWIDSSTRALLSFLCRNLLPQSLAVMLTVRTDELHRQHPLRPALSEWIRLPGVGRLDLQPLELDDLAALLRQVHAAPLPRDAVTRIAERSGGNPFFAEQLLVAGAFDADARLPDGLIDLLRYRVDQLTNEGRYVLEVASLAGQHIDHDVLMGVCDRKEHEITVALHEAADSRLFEADPSGRGYRFPHALLAEVIAADMMPTERRRIHDRFATFLEGRASAATIAHHRAGAGDLAGTFAASIDAAREATTIAAPADALSHWSRVLTLWPHGLEHDRQRAGGVSTVATTAARTAERAGEVSRAVELARLAAERAETPAQRVRARLVLIPLLTPLLTGAPNDYVVEATAALDEASGDDELTIRVMHTFAQAHFLAGHFDRAVPLAEAATEQAERHGGLDDVVFSARATAILARNELGDDQPDADAVLVPGALATDDIETGLWVLTKLADWYWPTDPVKGERIAAQAYRHATDHGAGTSIQAAWARVTLSLARWLSGRWDAIDELAEHEPLAVNDATAGAVALEAEVDIARGRLGRAQQRIHEAWQVADDASTRAFIAITEVNLHAARGNQRAAVASCVRNLDGLPPSSGFADSETTLVARGVAALADADDAGIDVPDRDALLDAAVRVDAQARADLDDRLTARPLSLMRAHRSRLVRSDAALWRAALIECDAMPYESARCHYHLAEVLLTTDLTDAGAELRAAAEHCRALGAVTLLGWVENLANRARIPLSNSDDERPAHERWNLTSRELQVLALMAKGRTNRQIGNDLFIAEKTASVHVSRILAKLKAQNRSEATAIARRSGLLPADDDR